MSEINKLLLKSFGPCGQIRGEYFIDKIQELNTEYKKHIEYYFDEKSHSIITNLIKNVDDAVIEQLELKTMYFSYGWQPCVEINNDFYCVIKFKSIRNQEESSGTWDTNDEPKMYVKQEQISIGIEDLD